MNTIYTKDQIDDLLAKSDELGIYHFGTGAFFSDTYEWTRVIEYAEKKYGGYDFNKSDLFVLDGINDNAMASIAYPEIHMYL